MGCNLFKRSSDNKIGMDYEQNKVNDFDPNPSVFKIIKYQQVNKNIVILINYPNCTNYEGNKILLFKNVSIVELSKLKEIDPHFSTTKLSPFARFEPTDKGWGLAVFLLQHI